MSSDSIEMQDFGFVKDLPKREVSRFRKTLDVLNDWKEVTRLHGSVVPAPFAAQVLGVTTSRLHQFIKEDRIVCIELRGHNYIPEDSLVKFANSERKNGRPCKTPRGLLATAKAAFKASGEMMRK